MATFHRVAAVLCVLLGLVFFAAAQAGNETGIDIEYGNFTERNFTDGNFTDDVSCLDLGCTGPGSRCIENDTDVFCACMEGYRLKSDMRTCESCPGGTYGLGCTSHCNCGNGNTCHKVTGMCICNSCYNGTNCEIALGGTCFLDFLRNPIKNEDSLQNTYGAQVYPTVDSRYTDDTFAAVADISTIDRDIIMTAVISNIPREEVNQGPLIQLKATLDKTQGSTAVANALDVLQNKVKVGDLAATLIIQDSLASTVADVTINAGIKRDEN